MNKYADLEIALSPEGEKYRVEMQLSLPGSDAPSGLTKAALAQFDTEALDGLGGQPEEYGKTLSGSLFTAEEAKAAGAFFKTARDVAAATGATLRVRLKIPPTAPALHPLRWETLRDPKPETEAFLFTDGRTPFSRFLTSGDLRPVETRPREDLKALVVIANPTDLKSIWKLAEVKVADVLKHAREGLKEIPLHALCRLDEGDAPVSGVEILGLPTLENLGAHLYSRYDILYLVCHGKLETQVVKGDGTRRVAKLWLERKDGSTDLVLPYEHTEKESGLPRAGLVERIQHLPQLPRLVVLASCQSFGGAEESASPHGGELAALGPLLAEAGVPAVIAMQGNVKVATLEQFMPAFFEELLRPENEGQIDLAMAAARAKVAAHRPDWWAPTLFMRLKSGRIGWHEPGFRRPDGRPDFRKWPAVVERIHDGKCTPILGPGLLDCLLGSVHKVARNWAEAHQFPMSPHQRDDLPTVAQYVSVDQDERYPYEQLGKDLRQSILEHYEHVFGPELQSVGEKSLDQLLDKVGKWRRGQDPSEPHRVLARLPFKVYITANPDNLLTSALTDPELEPKRTPHVELCPWKDELVRAPYSSEPSYEEPLVYHLFGKLDEPSSMVLTQDNYFDYLIGVTRNRKLIPPVVQTAMSGRLLLFLGFQIDDWSFRVLLRSIVGKPGSSLLKDYAHVAVQLDPEGERTSDPQAARRYLEDYFRDTAISIYWGRTEDFVRELQHQWNKEYGRERHI
jgi:hypothetical protein